MSKKITTEDFIARAREVHGDKYDYSKVEYIDSNKTKICIICPEHGEFWQLPYAHLNGQRCPKCYGSPKLNKEEFIQKAKEVHGDKYNYSKVEYMNSRTKICIICPEHGEFWQTPSSHLQGTGCPKCQRKSQTKTLQVFIEQAKAIHGDKYDYSKVEYVNTESPICIICPEHGEFWTTPHRHLRGAGCSKCWGRNKTNVDFIKEAQTIHGNKYDYSKVNYINSSTKICIICPEHGEFWVTPNNHLRGAGCPKCKRPNTGMSTEEFIQKAKEVHDDKYDYSRTVYNGMNEKVCIICPEHGEFWQRPNDHLRGHGCPYCKKILLELEVKKFLIENKIKYEQQKRFDWLKNKKLLSLDFYLPEHNIAIECQGIQHFEPVEFFGGYKSFKKQLINDKLKTQLCNKHGIIMLYYTKNNNNYISNLSDLKSKIYASKIQ